MEGGCGLRSVDGGTRGERRSDLEALNASVVREQGGVTRLVERIEKWAIVALVGTVEVVGNEQALLGERLIREGEERAAIGEVGLGALQKRPAYQAADLGDHAVLRLLVAVAEQPRILGVFEADDRAPQAAGARDVEQRRRIVDGLEHLVGASEVGGVGHVRLDAWCRRQAVGVSDMGRGATEALGASVNDKLMPAPKANARLDEPMRNDRGQALVLPHEFGHDVIVSAGDPVGGGPEQAVDEVKLELANATALGAVDVVLGLHVLVWAAIMAAE